MEVGAHLAPLQGPALGPLMGVPSGSPISDGGEANGLSCYAPEPGEPGTAPEARSFASTLTAFALLRRHKPLIF